MKAFIDFKNGQMQLGQAVNEHGVAVSRSKMDHPYSYDGFVTWRGLSQEQLNLTLYSDRLRQKYSEQWDALCIKHFGNKSDYFDDRSPKNIENFLNELLGQPESQLGLIMEYCNVSNGFPVWRFDLKTA